MSFSGILLLDKPGGFTSHDAVAKLRGMCKTRKVGHAGTLDPAATGVLPLFLGAATPFVDLLPSSDKTYTATVQLGVVTDSQDLTGTVLETHPVTPGEEEVRRALAEMQGDQMQLPPMYSAVQHGGKRLYDLARKGLEVERSPRPVTIHAIELLEAHPQAGRYTFSVRCSKGTYIRTLCHDLGRALGCGGALAALRRTAACGFSLEDCRTLEALQALRDQNALEEALLPVAAAFEGLPRLELDPRQTRLFGNGVRLALEEFPQVTRRHTVFGWDGRFLGLAQPDETGALLLHVRRYTG